MNLLYRVLKKNFYNENNIRHFYMISIVVFSLLTTLYCQYPLLSNEYAISDDVRGDIYGYMRYRDKELFKDDFIADFILKWAPWGEKIFYFLISLFYDPIKSTKFLPFFLCFISALYMFKLGAFLGNNIVGLIASFLYILSIWSPENGIFIGTNTGRDFGIMFFIIFVYYFLKKKLWHTSLILVFELLFYPPAFLISWLTYVISIFHLFFKKKLKQNKEELYHLIGLSLISLLILSLKYFDNQLKLMSLGEIIKMPEFYPGGRRVLFYDSIYKQLTNAETGFALLYPTRLLFLIFILLLVVLKKKAMYFPMELWFVVLSSFIFFIIATGLIYKLYGPARYVRFSIPIILIIFLSLNLQRLIQKIHIRKIRLVFLLICFIVIFILFFPHLHCDYSIAPHPNLYSFLQKLPKDIFIAGHPTFMDFVPVFAKRKVLINEETSLPYFSNFYPEIKKRTYDFFTAYYTTSPKEIYDFCKKYGITHFIVDKSHFSQDYLAKGKFYLNPFNSYIKDIIKGKTKFTLPQIPESEKIFEEGDVFVVEVKDSPVWNDK